MKTKTKKQKLYSVEQYATLCGITKTAVYNRIALKEIITTETPDYSGQVIDASIYPPKSEKKRGRPLFIQK